MFWIYWELQDQILWLEMKLPWIRVSFKTHFVHDHEVFSSHSFKRGGILDHLIWEDRASPGNSLESVTCGMTWKSPGHLKASSRAAQNAATLFLLLHKDATTAKA